MAMSKRLGDSETFDDFWPLPGPSYGFALAGSRRTCVVPSTSRQTGRIVAVSAGIERLPLTQISLMWQLSFFSQNRFNRALSARWR